MPFAEYPKKKYRIMRPVANMTEGWMEGKKVTGYRKEKNVAPDSNTETFAAVKFFIDNWRWQGVPFYVRTGKYLHEKTTVLTIQFKPAPAFAFPKESAETWRPNRLSISIAPEMDIRLHFQAKRPGQAMILSPVDMVFNYKDEYNGEEPEAYETLLYDVMEGDATLFMRADQVEAAWEVVMPILDVWKARKPMDFPNYSPGSWGPEDAEALSQETATTGLIYLQNINKYMKLHIYKNKEKLAHELALWMCDLIQFHFAKPGIFYPGAFRR